MAKLSFLLLQVLSNWTSELHFYDVTRESINKIFYAMNREQEIHTITYFGKIKDISPYLTISAGLPKVVISEPVGDLEFYKGAGFNNQMVFLAIGNLRNLAMWQHMSNAFKNVQGYARGIFIIPQRIQWPLDVLKQHFTWCWRKGFSDVLVFLETSQQANGLLGFSYVRFPELYIQNVEISNTTYYFPNKLLNLHGAIIRTPVQFDPPRVFAKPPMENSSKIYGYAAKIFLSFLKLRNGQLAPLYSNKSVYDIQSIIKQLHNGEIDFSMHPFGPVADVHLTYPIRMLRWCLMVPFEGEVEPYVYFMRPFQLNTWLLLMGLLCLLSLVYSISTMSHNCHNPALDYWRAFIFILRLMITQAAPLPRLSSILFPHAFLLLIVILFGFLLTNLYLATLTSFFTTTLYNEQLNSLADVVTANLSVEVGAFETSVVLQNYALPKGFVDLLLPKSSSDMIYDVLTLQPGRAYTAREDLLNFALVQLKYLKKPEFRLAEECVTTLPVGFLLPTHSQFETALNLYIMRCEAAGLIKKWLADSYAEGLETGIVHIHKEETIGPQPLSVQYLQFHWLLLAMGLTLSVLVFLLERFRQYCTRVRIHYIIDKF